MEKDLSPLALKAKLLCTLAWRLAQAGAETRLIVQSLKKISCALDIKNNEIGISRSGVIVKLTQGNEQVIEYKEIKFLGINMYQVSCLHKICLQVEKGELLDPKQILHKIRATRPVHYSKNLLIVLEAIAAGAFAYLNGASIAACLCSIIGGIVLMSTRFCCIKRRFFENFAFMLAAFLGCSTTYLCANYIVQLAPDEIPRCMIATSLILVPGFPFINGFLDVFKGYVDIGLIRLFNSLVLTMSAAIGVSLAILLTTGALPW